MTAYETLQIKKDFCTHLAQTTTDNSLRTFYAHAAQGYKIKQEKLTLVEASK